MPRVDIVTVFFGLEIPFMKIQARSLDICFTNDLINQIIVVANEPTIEREAATIARFKNEVLPLYGRFLDRVIVLGASRFGSLSAEGWLTQQACKLTLDRCELRLLPEYPPSHPLPIPLERATFPFYNRPVAQTRGRNRGQGGNRHPFFLSEQGGRQY